MDSGRGAGALPPARCRIRASPDRRLLTAPRGLSQPTTPFVGSWRQGIPRTPLLAPRPLPRGRATRRILRSYLQAMHLFRYGTPRWDCRPRSSVRVAPRQTLLSTGHADPLAMRVRLFKVRGGRARDTKTGRASPPAGCSARVARAQGLGWVPACCTLARVLCSGARAPRSLSIPDRRPSRPGAGGAGEIRTPDLPRARRALSH